MHYLLSFNGTLHERSTNALRDNIATAFLQKDCESLTVLFSSDGGGTDQGLSLYNFIRSLPRPIRMHAVGHVGSAAFPVFLAGHSRTCAPFSRFDAFSEVAADGRRAAVAASLRACALAAFNAALTVARADNPVSRIGRVVEREVSQRGFHIIRALSGHGTGRSIHEEPQVPNYFERRQTDILKEGLVIAIEPIISAGSGTVYEDADGWTIRTRDGSLAAHHENTVVITKGEPIIVTTAA